MFGCSRTSDISCSTNVPEAKRAHLQEHLVYVVGFVCSSPGSGLHGTFSRHGFLSVVLRMLYDLSHFMLNQSSCTDTMLTCQISSNFLFKQRSYACTSFTCERHSNRGERTYNMLRGGSESVGSETVGFQSITAKR